MSEELVNSDKDLVIEQFYELKYKALNAILNYYSNIFDKIFKKLIQNSRPEDKEKFEKIKSNHLKQYQCFVDKTLDQQMDLFFSDSEVIQKLNYLLRNSLSDDMIDVQKAVQPIKQSFVNQLNDLQNKVSNDYELKVEQNKRLTTNLDELVDTFHNCRKTLYEVLFTIKTSFH
jgi:hypothetical protein